MDVPMGQKVWQTTFWRRIMGWPPKYVPRQGRMGIKEGARDLITLPYDETFADFLDYLSRAHNDELS